MFDLGVSINPISLDAPEDNPSLLKAKLEEARNKAIIQEAEFTNDPLELCLAVAKTCIEGDLATKNRVLNKILIKYFQEKIEMKISHEYFQTKPETDYSDPETVPNLQQLILYGVDFLTTNAIRARLKEVQTQIKEIIWINDSTCKIVCRSEQEGKRILTNQVCVIKLDQNERDIRSWCLMKPYTIFSFDRNLWIRYATSKQSNVERKKSSKYNEYSKAKNYMALYFLEKFNALERYKEVIEQIEEKKRSKNRRGNKEESRQRLYSRSRDKNPNRDLRHNQRALFEENQKRRQNRFAKYNALSHKATLRQQVTNIRYEHVLIGKRTNDTSFDQEGKRISQKTNAINTDLQLNKQKEKNSLTFFDNISEIDSSLSFIFKGKDNNEQDRMDFQYQLRSQKQHSENSDNLEYQLQSKIQNKNQHNSSFRDRNTQFNDKDKERNNRNDSFAIERKDAKEQQQSDFFDFKDIKKEAISSKDSKLNNSFKYDKKQKSANKKISNHYEDDSY